MNRSILQRGKKAVKNPAKAVNYGINSMDRILKYPFEVLLQLQYGSPTNHFTQDWDNLLILDACRYDTFGAVSELDGDLDSIISLGSATLEWLDKTIGDRTYYDTVVVTAQPRYVRYESQFHAVDHIWDKGWDEELNVTPPGPVVEGMKTAREKYPDKRLVAHFMQPHTPYIGEFARDRIGIRTGDSPARDRALGNDVSGDDWYHALDALEDGKLSKDVVQKAYYENLRHVLQEIRELVKILDGKTVVSADHGDLFGEWAWPYPRRLYGHPPEIPAVKLRQVPWLVVDGERRETNSEPPQTTNQIDDSQVSHRLQQLGYLKQG